MNKIVVISVHPDDETLGCGGTLLKHKANRDKIYWLICTNLPKNHSYYKKREEEIKKVASLYNFDEVYNLNFETMRVDEYSMSELIGNISNVINKIKPNIVYLPFKNDVHSDHRKIFEAVYSCTKIFRYPFIRKILMMETLSETDFSDITNSFVPNVFVDISEFLDKKLEIMRVYESEIGKHPFPRSEETIKALAKVRGAQAGVKYAESFMLLKEIL